LRGAFSFFGLEMFCSLFFQRKSHHREQSSVSSSSLSRNTQISECVT
jgi:hypothetical protein